MPGGRPSHRSRKRHFTRDSAGHFGQCGESSREPHCRVTRQSPGKLGRHRRSRAHVEQIAGQQRLTDRLPHLGMGAGLVACFRQHPAPDRKSTRLNSSHGYISYAVFCLKKKKKKKKKATTKKIRPRERRATRVHNS